MRGAPAAAPTPEARDPRMSENATAPTKTASKNKTTPKFPEVGGVMDLPKVEAEILAFWRDDDTFRASVETRPEDNHFVFYDGPPFANGLPHYGHLLTGFAKDVIPRFQTMLGKRVERRFGWDTHGLPAELEAEKDLGISGRKAVLEMGIDKFNAAARAGVMKYASEWEDYVTRQARWVDFENDYKTLDISYMESGIWAFKQLWDKGLVYKDYRVVPYSWAVESPLSNFETRLDNSYRNRTDPAVTVGYEIAADQGPLSGAQMLIWTTTPWTLPSNLAVAVGSEIVYAVMEKDGRRFILSEKALDRYKKQLKGAERVDTVSGEALRGLRYHPPFDYFLKQENAFQALLGDFVLDDEGTGIVHMAPGFGEDDLHACRAAGIGIVVPVDQSGRYTREVSDYEGMLVFDANKPIIQRLKEEGKLFRHDTYDHNYPHCWRTDEPLIYKAVDSWYLKVSAFRDRMVELNEQITWVPGHIKHGMWGNWLANAQDWNISRSRFWGTPLPIWVSDDPAYPRMDVYGSIAELEEAFGVKVDDLHRPYIDALTRPNPDDPTGKSTMRRVDDVFDVWFDSGSMPYAQVHYPFENKEWFEKNFPADYIVEYVAQTRGWFYTLMVLSTMLFDRPPFKTAMCHGVVLDENRQKLSKRKRNYPDPMAFFDKFGSDTMRWFLISSPVLGGGDLLVPKEGRDIAVVQREAIAPFLNAYSFFSLYANLETRKPRITRKSDDILDRYILSKTGALAAAVRRELSDFHIPRACAEVTAYFDALTNWYIRRSRARFWGSAGEDAKNAAFDTLYTVLVRLSHILAPLLPIVSEKVFQSLTGKRSVHLELWPDKRSFPKDEALVRDMDLVRDACSAALAVRERARLRVRLPLKKMSIVHENSEAIGPYADLIRDEVNVREIELSTDLAAHGTLELKVAPTIGKRLGPKMKAVLGAARAGEFSVNADGTVTVAGEVLSGDDFAMRVVAAEGSAAEPFAGTGAILLDVSVDQDQEREGLSRDLIRAVQQARKEANFHVSDRIRLSIAGGDRVAEAVDAFKDDIMSETLAIALQEGLTDAFEKEAEILGETVSIGVAKVA